jgi:RluA family pseudouridine synthase
MNNETTLKSKVPQKSSGTSLLNYISGRFRYHSSSDWESRIRDGKVLINGGEASPESLVFGGDWVAYQVVLHEPPVDDNISILHEEARFLVAFKPGQLPSHADGNFIKHTFIYILGQRMWEKGYKGELRLAHRLDRETSGLLLVAKDLETEKKIKAQFERGQVKKEYLAVARGVIKDDSFEVGDAIGPDLSSAIKIRRAVVPSGTPDSKESFTRFEVLRRMKDSTYVRCLPATGRTNQIRVHLASLGHSIVGDKLYGRTDEQFLEYLRHVKAGGDPGFAGHCETLRHLLHASRLEFHHPHTGKPVVFKAELPLDMEKYLQTE